ncbi:DEAD/DEAH box helicase [Oxalobacteraceae bacterium CAVE-383]|nr:DEAD/DEAH box helicase [Oxalobacteraceae bacterium CAVE-383]
MPFSSLGLLPSLARAASDMGFLAPTPVQSAAIPAILRGADVLASAQTGSGKTAAFALPLLQMVLQEKQEKYSMQVSAPRRQRQACALILAPTRELAAQAGANMESLMRHVPHPPKIAVLFGGVSINPQMMALRGGADIVVATPGRLLDLIDHNALAISSVSMLVLDEADRLLDMGFADELGRILSLLPAQRQTLLFSATFPPAVAALAESILRDPVRIEAADAEHERPDIAERAIAVDAGRRTQLLRHLIGQEKWERTLVFVASKYAADLVADKLRRAGIDAGAFHGDLSQGARTQLLAEFKNTKLRVLVATDVAARGIDIAQLPAVVNYDLPRSTVEYTHRIGRTGRAGASGVAVSFVSADTEAHFRLIEKRRQTQIPRERIAGFEPVDQPRPDLSGLSAEEKAKGGVKGARMSKKDKLRAAAQKSGG